MVRKKVLTIYLENKGFSCSYENKIHISKTYPLGIFLEILSGRLKDERSLALSTSYCFDWEDFIIYAEENEEENDKAV